MESLIDRLSKMDVNQEAEALIISGNFRQGRRLVSVVFAVDASIECHSFYKSFVNEILRMR